MVTLPGAHSVSLHSLSTADLMNTGDTVYDRYMNAAGNTNITVKASYLSQITLATSSIAPSTKTVTIDGLKDGSYVFTLSRNGYLRRDIGVTVSGTDVNLGDKSLFAGEVYVDRIIDGSDSESLFSAIGYTYGAPKYVPNYDLNLDGIIDGTDTEMVFANLGLDVSCYGENVDYYN